MGVPAGASPTIVPGLGAPLMRCERPVGGHRLSQSSWPGPRSMEFVEVVQQRRRLCQFSQSAVIISRSECGFNGAAAEGTARPDAFVLVQPDRGLGEGVVERHRDRADGGQHAVEEHRLSNWTGVESANPRASDGRDRVTGPVVSRIGDRGADLGGRAYPFPTDLCTSRGAHHPLYGAPGDCAASAVQVGPIVTDSYGLSRARARRSQLVDHGVPQLPFRRRARQAQA